MKLIISIPLLLSQNVNGSLNQSCRSRKVIENTQRDINISIVNEFALIFDKIGIDTTEVLEAASASTFKHFKPGLVGGHCIAVDPYYLSYKAKSAGKSADLIDTARKINNSIPSFIAEKVYNGVKSLDGETRKPKVLILGFTFKADCPDLRNSKVFDIMQRLIDLEINVDAYDPWVKRDLLNTDYNSVFLEKLTPNAYDGIIIAVITLYLKALVLCIFVA